MEGTVVLKVIYTEAPGNIVAFFRSNGVRDFSRVTKRKFRRAERTKDT